MERRWIVYSEDLGYFTGDLMDPWCLIASEALHIDRVRAEKIARVFSELSEGSSKFETIEVND